MKEILFFPVNPAAQLIFLYRIYSFIHKYKLLHPVSYFIYYVTRIIYSSDIHPLAKIGKGFRVRHHFGIVIGKNVVIGKNAVVYNDVSIGQLNVASPVMPVLGDNCVIYKGAVIVGNVSLPDGTVVGANKFIRP